MSRINQRSVSTSAVVRRTSIDAMSAYGELGLILGIGVGFGVEVSDWILRPRRGQTVKYQIPADEA